MAALEEGGAAEAENEGAGELLETKQDMEARHKRELRELETQNRFRIKVLCAVWVARAPRVTQVVTRKRKEARRGSNRLKRKLISSWMTCSTVTDRS